MRVGLLVVIVFLPPSLLHSDDAPKPAAIKKLIQQLGDADEGRAVAIKKLREHGHVVLPYLKAEFKRKGDLGERARELWLKIAGYDPKSVRSWGVPKSGTQVDPVFDLPVEVIHNRTEIEMVLIPPGQFMMGASKGDKEAFRYNNTASEEKPHRVKITKPFYLGKFEITVEQWLRVIILNPTRYRSRGRRPVEHVNLGQVRWFLALTALRLPTEAEWEYACRAGTTGPRYGPIDEIAWYGGISTDFDTKVVGLKKPNAFGLYDMLGNVFERCGRGDVVRGGGVWSGAFMVRVSTRPRIGDDYRNSDLGFRVARDP